MTALSRSNVRPSSRRWASAWSLVWGAIFVAAGSSASPVVGQTLEINELPATGGKMVDLTLYKNDPKKLSSLSGQLIGFAPNGKANNAAEAELFEKYYWAKIAELTWSNGTTVDAKRLDLKKRHLKTQFQAAQFPDLHDKLNQLLLTHLPTIAANKQFPLNVRYAAILLLGQLDKIEFDLGKLTPPVALVDVTPILVGYANQKDLPESLRIAALIGLARQAELQIPGTVRAPIAAVAAATLGSKKPPEGYSVAGHQWARRLATQIVVGLCKTGNELSRPETVKALYDIFADPQEPLFLRRDATLAFGHLEPSAIAAGGGVKPADVVKALANFTHELTHAGGPRSDPSAPPNLAKAEDVFVLPMEKKLFTDGVSYYLNCIATALGGRSNRGLKNVPGLDKNTPPGSLADQLLKNHVDPMLVALQSTKFTVDQMPLELAAKGSKLNEWLQANNLLPEAAPAGKVVGGGF
jgi:hypothetical protein